MAQIKRTTVVAKVIKQMSATMIIVNIIAISGILMYARTQMDMAQEDYLVEVVNNITSVVETTMEEYITSVEILAKNRTIVEILSSSSKTNPMENHPSTATMLEELSDIVTYFSGSVEILALISAEQDSYLMHNGSSSSPSVSMVDRPYYSCITSQKTTISEPYIHSTTGTMVVSVAAPVFSNSRLVGCVTLSLPTAFISQLISDFGSTGNTWVVSNQNEILAHKNSSYIGQLYSSMGISGDAFAQQMNNPTGELIEFSLNGVTRIGSVGNIPSLGWKMIAGIDKSEFNETTNTLTFALWVIQSISMCIALAMCAFTVITVLKPLKSLNSAMLEMSKGNLKHQLTHQGNDEIGELFDNLRTTMTNLAIYIREIHKNLEAFGNGDFTRKSELVFLGDFREIQTSTDVFVELITQTLESLKDTVEQVSVGSDYVALGSQSLAEGSARQSASISDLNKFIEDITSKIHENANAVNDVHMTAQNISRELEEGNQQMDHMMIAMIDIQEKSDGIRKIVKTIEDVAFQTNILALNAAVESARAGTSGRGFAVVAEEVRNLSARTSEAVKNTTALISESTASVDKGSQIAETTILRLKSVTSDISGFINTLDGITEASQEQTVAIERINAEVGSITSVMQSNSAVSEESAATSEELSSQATVMKDAIEQFKLDEK